VIIQKCVKGIAGCADGITEDAAYDMIRKSIGIVANRWRVAGQFAPDEIATQLTDNHLDRHLHDYVMFGRWTPFISLATGAVERDQLLRQNQVYSAIDTALQFATGNWQYPGALVYCWVLTGVKQATENHMVAESVRDLLIYRRWSRWQLEGEVTAKVWVPSNQIERVEWWDGAHSKAHPARKVENSHYVAPAQLSNVREVF
jgi:hypothetical protein